MRRRLALRRHGNFIEPLEAEFVTAGFEAPGFYCPSSPNTRGQMATFLVKALGLP